MFIGNVPKELQASRKKKGGAVLLGHIPEVRAMVLSHANGLTVSTGPRKIVGYGRGSC